MKLKLNFYACIQRLFSAYNPVYFRNLKVIGIENIPKTGGILFSPNHQNALIDPILVGTTCGKIMHSLVRADVFDGLLRHLLLATNSLPVYRIRDGYENLKRNEKSFEKCRQLLAQSEHLLMFSEGLHHEEYYLKRLSKGSSRLAMEAQQKNPNTSIHLQPVGLNYSHKKQPYSDVIVVYGKPFSLLDYLDDYVQDPAKTINRIRNRLQDEMEKCLWLPKNEKHYFFKKTFINRRNTPLPFEELKKRLSQIETGLHLPKKSNFTLRFLIVLFSIPNLPIHLFLWGIQRQFPDVVFHGTVNYIGHFIFLPIWWAIGIFGFFSEGGPLWAIGFFISSVIFIYTRQKLITFCL